MRLHKPEVAAPRCSALTQSSNSARTEEGTWAYQTSARRILTAGLPSAPFSIPREPDRCEFRGGPENGTSHARKSNVARPPTTTRPVTPEREKGRQGEGRAKGGLKKGINRPVDALGWWNHLGCACFAWACNRPWLTTEVCCSLLSSAVCTLLNGRCQSTCSLPSHLSRLKRLCMPHALLPDLSPPGTVLHDRIRQNRRLSLLQTKRPGSGRCLLADLRLL